MPDDEVPSCRNRGAEIDAARDGFTSIATGGGTLGDVLTKEGDGVWRAGPPNQVAPGAVHTGVGIDGDGTPANPLRIRLCNYGDLKNACFG